jgi:hypothetical protein
VSVLTEFVESTIPAQINVSRRHVVGEESAQV